MHLINLKRKKIGKKNQTANHLKYLKITDHETKPETAELLHSTIHMEIQDYSTKPCKAINCVKLASCCKLKDKKEKADDRRLRSPGIKIEIGNMMSHALKHGNCFDD